MAARPRTLPLAVAPIALAGGLAAHFGLFRLVPWVLCFVTAGLLQVLSNFANDLGDAVKGTDNEARLGPPRAVSSGLISAGEMKRAVVLTASLACLSGLALLVLTLPGQEQWVWAVFATLGLGAIAAACLYTLGKKPYGYAGLGELFVALFFGFVGVSGTFTLVSGRFEPVTLFAGAGVGLLAAGVLHLNNMRDIENDLANGKKTLATRLGVSSSVYFYAALLFFGFLGLMRLGRLFPDKTIHLSVIVISILIPSWLFVRFSHVKEAKQLNPELGVLALTTALSAIALGVGLAMVPYKG